MTNAAKKYYKNDLQTSIDGASSYELMILVYEKLLDNLNLGKKALEDGSYGINYFTNAEELLNQGLLACLNYQKGGEIATNLKVIYEWSLLEIIKGRITKSPETIQNVIDTLRILFEGWQGINPSPKKPILSLI
jgi:flagellar protein FliS